MPSTSALDTGSSKPTGDDGQVTGENGWMILGELALRRVVYVPCGWCWAVLVSAQRTVSAPGERNNAEELGDKVLFLKWAVEASELTYS